MSIWPATRSARQFLEQILRAGTGQLDSSAAHLELRNLLAGSGHLRQGQTGQILETPQAELTFGDHLLLETAQIRYRELRILDHQKCLDRLGLEEPIVTVERPQQTLRFGCRPADAGEGLGQGTPHPQLLVRCRA